MENSNENANETNKLFIRFDNLDDSQKTFTSFFTLCNYLITYYANKTDSEDLEHFITWSSVYFGHFLNLLGTDIDDLDLPAEGEPHGDIN